MPQFKHKYTNDIVTARGKVAKALDTNPRYERVKDDGLFDPSKHGVTKVLEYLAEADEAEKARVLAAEAAGKKRPGIVGDAS